MFILTDGKNYVMENPMQQGKYISSTSPCHAKEFTWKQAKNLLNNNRKSLSWIKNGYYVMDKDTGKVEKQTKYDLEATKEHLLVRNHTGLTSILWKA